MKHLFELPHGPTLGHSEALGHVKETGRRRPQTVCFRLRELSRAGRSAETRCRSVVARGGVREGKYRVSADGHAFIS